MASEIGGSFENTLLMEPFLVSPTAPDPGALPNKTRPPTARTRSRSPLGGEKHVRSSNGASFGPSREEDPRMVGMMHLR